MTESQQQETHGGRQFLSLIAESSSQAKEAMSDIIWSINPENDSWENVASKLRRYASDLCESKGIAHRIEMPAAGTSFMIEAERRRHFWLLFKEVVTNAVRHARCTEITIQVGVRDGKVTLQVCDNGVGFDPHSETTGHGLKNIEARAKSLQAAAHLSTSPGQGTRWEFEFSAL
jgi:signal transduction histidine kinase